MPQLVKCAYTRDLGLFKHILQVPYDLSRPVSEMLALLVCEDVFAFLRQCLKGLDNASVDRDIIRLFLTLGLLNPQNLAFKVYIRPLIFFLISPSPDVLDDIEPLAKTKPARPVGER